MGDVINAQFGQSNLRTSEVAASASATAATQPAQSGTSARPPDPFTTGMTHVASLWQEAQSAMSQIAPAIAFMAVADYQQILSRFEEIRQAIQQLQARVTADAAGSALLAWQQDIQQLAANVTAFKTALTQTVAQLPPSVQALVSKPNSGMTKKILWSVAAVAGAAVLIGGGIWIVKAVNKSQKRSSKRLAALPAR